MKTALSLTFISLLLASCSFIPEMTKPSVEIPQRWRGMEAQNIGTPIPAQWWTIYNDAPLNHLINTAETQNLDIRAGVEKINQANAALEIAGASLLPNVSGTAGLGKTRTNPDTGKTTSVTALSGGLSVAYELDLFGTNASKRAEARALRSSAQYTQESLRLVTEASVASTYFNLLAAQERVRIAEQNLKNAKDIQGIIQARFDNGLDSGLELAQQKEAVANREATLATLRQTNTIYHNALALLLGHAPQTFEMDVSSNINTLVVPDIEPSQPSVLLERRPDIHAIEAQLIAANANIGAARAAFYPSVSLGVTGSLSSTGFSDPATTVLGLASSLAAPIFQGGALTGGLHAANASQRELVEVYRKIVLTAFKEVEDALASVTAAEARQKALKEAVSQSQKAYDISRKRYDVGTIDFQTLLTTQTNLLLAEDSYAQALNDKLTASADLVKSLGGGWKDNTQPLPAESTAPEPAGPLTPELPAEPEITKKL